MNEDAAERLIQAVNSVAAELHETNGYLKAILHDQVSNATAREQTVELSNRLEVITEAIQSLNLSD